MTISFPGGLVRPSIREGGCRVGVAALLLAATMGCGLDQQEVPSLSGPSSLANAVTLSASPTQLARDGVSQSRVTVTARDVTGGPLAGQRISLRATPIDAILSATEVTTDQAGLATFIVTAPPAVSSASDISIEAIPIGGFSDSVPRTLLITLLGSVVETVPAPSISSVTVAPTSPIVDAQSSFTVAAEPGEGRAITQYTWTFGDGTPPQITTVPATTHTFTDPGTVVVTVTVRDDVGQTTSRSTSVTVTTGVTASFTMSPTNPRTGDTVQFDPRSSTIPAHISVKEYRWDYGNGSTETTTPESPVGFTAFATARTYTIRLTVVDTKGRMTTATQTLSVATP